MSKNKENLCKLRGERLKSCIDRYKLKQKDLEKPIDKEGHTCCTESDVSQWVRGKKLLTESKISDLLQYVPEFKDVKKEYLLGDIEYMTLVDYQRTLNDKFTDVNNATSILLEYALIEVCGIENRPTPTIEAPEAMFLTDQLKDEAKKLIWAYLHQDASNVWNFINR